MNRRSSYSCTHTIYEIHIRRVSKKCPTVPQVPQHSTPLTTLRHFASSGFPVTWMPHDPLASGFTFNQYHANDTTRKVKAATKTGTTICGVVFSSGVVLGADTRSTNGETVADKNCAKIHYLAPNMFCCGAGTAADTEAVTGRLTTRLQSFSNLPSGSVSSELLLHRSFSDRPSK